MKSICISFLYLLMDATPEKQTGQHCTFLRQDEKMKETNMPDQSAARTQKQLTEPTRMESYRECQGFFSKHSQGCMLELCRELGPQDPSVSESSRMIMQHDECSNICASEIPILNRNPKFQE